ncbi:uncharacterized protein IL334_003031 [Kwoniella shivajii]|uniref:Glycerate-and formate-dehydrogenase n=1 Tax=Kwoniella shivajii TaxID=564305 RepID=A0ABZ1CWE3_9TREE|nr:hypothetical protein IL334_003031 [Kwoniella shivajii]
MVAVTSKPKILGIGYPKYAIAEFKALQEKYDIHYFVPSDRKQVIGEVKRLCDEEGPFDGGYVLFQTSAYSPFKRDMLAPLLTTGTCGIWAQGGAGYDDVEVDFITDNNSWFTNTPYAVTNATADMGAFLTLAALRGVYEGESNVRAGKWRNGMALTTDPNGLKLGIVGMGAIGKSMAVKLQVFGMKVYYYNRKQLSPEEEKALGVTYSTFEDLITTSDVISLNCPLTPETRHLIGEKEFAKMKDGVFIVNTARGAVIDESALVEALKSGKVSRAGLDVFEEEPKINPYLLTCNRVTLQPHLGAMSTGTIHTGEKAIFSNLEAYFETGTPITPVNKPLRAVKQKQ